MKWLIKPFLIVLLASMVILGYWGCTSSPTNPQSPNNQNQGSGGSTTQTITISGSITGAYNNQWKVYARKDQNTYYGTIDSSTTNFTIQVPANSGIVQVGVYKDNNNNSQFDLSEDNISQNVNVGSQNISGITINIPLFVTISGTLTGSPTPQWKVYALVNFSVEYYGSVNSSYQYTVSVPSNSYVEIRVFKDNNNSGLLDPGEYYVSTNIGTVTNNLNNVDINIPNLINNTFTISVTNNIYGLKLGVWIGVNGAYSLSGTTSATNFQFTLNIDAPLNQELHYGIYYDKNSNNTFDFEYNNILGILPKDPIIDLGVFTNTTSSFSTNVTLTPHVITGTVEYIGGASGFSPVLEYMGISFVLGINPAAYGTVSGNNYEIKFYTPSNNITTSLSPRMFKDNDGNGYANNIIGNDDFVVWDNGSSSIIINNDTPSTNTANFYILKTTVNVSLSGTDASSFKFVDTLNYFKGMWGLTPSYMNLPVNNYQLYSDTNSQNQLNFFLFKDMDNNGLFDSTFDTYLFLNNIISNQTTTSINLDIVKYTVTNTIIGDYSSYTDPYVLAQFSFIGQSKKSLPTYSSLTNTIVLEAYRITNNPYGLLSVSLSVNSSGNYIATNSNGNDLVSISDNQDLVTNITWYITN